MGVVFNPSDTRPLMGQIAQAEGGPNAWAIAYAAWVYSAVTHALNEYMVAPPWHSRVALHAFGDYREHTISTDDGEVRLSLGRWGHHLSLDLVIFENDDRAYLLAVPGQIARATTRTLDRQIAQALDDAYGEPVHVALRDTTQWLVWELWMGDSADVDGCKTWGGKDSLRVCWGLGFGVASPTPGTAPDLMLLHT